MVADPPNILPSPPQPIGVESRVLAEPPNEFLGDDSPGVILTGYLANARNNGFRLRVILRWRCSLIVIHQPHGIATPQDIGDSAKEVAEFGFQAALVRARWSHRGEAYAYSYNGTVRAGAPRVLRTCSMWRTVSGASSVSP
jgi:hypothetical protein